jgi:acetolactate synthase-1/2/3 large subunit
MRLADYVIQRIADEGVRHIFTLPGGGAMHLDDALGRCADIDFVCNLHEQASAIAAEAYARVTNNLGVALVTTGPGGTNAITGVAGAWLESTPCLVISGQVKRADMKRDLGVRQLGAQELDVVALVDSITKYAVTVLEPDSIRYHLEKAIHLAKSGRPGPVWIDIPLDVQAAQIDPERLEAFRPEPISSADREEPGIAEQVGRVIALLNEAERPVLIAGNGIRLAGAREAFLQLVETLGIPVLATWMGTDLLWEDHPLFFGKPGTVAARGANFTLQNSDLVLSIGARLDFAVTGFDQSQFARAARKVVVDIDPAEIRKLGMKVDIPVVADAGAFIGAVLGRSESIGHSDRSDWFDRCREWRTKYPVVLPEYWDEKKFVNTYVFSSVLAEELEGSDLIVPGSSGVGIDTFWLSFRVKQGQRLFSTGGLGAMGFGLPASIGACLASGGKRTVSVDGDGGFQLNIQELETLARLGLPVKCFVLNNQGYASIRAMQRGHFEGRLFACDETCGLTLPDLRKLGVAYGIPAYRIEDHSGLREGIREALDTPGPVLCEVMVDPDQGVGPRVTSTVLPDGSIVSKPLEDLWPFLNRDEFLSNMLIPVVAE